MVMKPSGLGLWLTPGEASISAFKIWWVGLANYSSVASKTSLNKYPCSLDYYLLIWRSLPLSSVSPDPVYNYQFQISPRKLLQRLQTNMAIVFNSFKCLHKHHLIKCSQQPREADVLTLTDEGMGALSN